jgi:hypothetical protein
MATGSRENESIPDAVQRLVIPSPRQVEAALGPPRIGKKSLSLPVKMVHNRAKNQEVA